MITGKALTKENQDSVHKALGFISTALLVFAFVALIVGMFIIYNTFSIVVAQRMREMALLRAIGASKRQVLASVIGESVVVGVLASAVGVDRGYRVVDRAEGRHERGRLPDPRQRCRAAAERGHHRIARRHDRHDHLRRGPGPPGGPRPADRGDARGRARTPDQPVPPARHRRPDPRPRHPFALRRPVRQQRHLARRHRRVADARRRVRRVAAVRAATGPDDRRPAHETARDRRQPVARERGPEPASHRHDRRRGDDRGLARRLHHDLRGIGQRVDRLRDRLSS